MSVTIFSKINPIISVGFLEVPFGIVGKRVKLPPTRPHPSKTGYNYARNLKLGT